MNFKRRHDRTGNYKVLPEIKTFYCSADREVLLLLVLLHVLSHGLQLGGLHVLAGDVKATAPLPALAGRHQLELRALVHGLHV